MELQHIFTTVFVAVFAVAAFGFTASITQAAQPGDVVITEAFVNEGSVETDYVTLENRTNSDIDIDGWKISDAEGDGQSVNRINATTSLQANDSATICSHPASSSDCTDGFANSDGDLNLNQTGDTINLEDKDSSTPTISRAVYIDSEEQRVLSFRVENTDKNTRYTGEEVDYALSQASANQTVALEGGNYTFGNPITIYKEGITLKASDSAESKPVITNDNDNTNSPTVKLTAASTTLKGLNLRREKSSKTKNTQVVYVQASDTTVANNEISWENSGGLGSSTNNNGIGLLVIGNNGDSPVSNVELTNNEIAGAQFGLMVTTYPNYDSGVQNVNITKNELSANGDAVVVKKHDGASNAPEDIIFSDNAVEDNRCALAVPGQGEYDSTELGSSTSYQTESFDSDLIAENVSLKNSLANTVDTNQTVSFKTTIDTTDKNTIKNNGAVACPRPVRGKLALSEASQVTDVNLEYKNKDGDFENLVFNQGETLFGPQSGFPLTQTESKFKINLTSADTYESKISLVSQGSSSEVFASSSVSVTAENQQSESPSDESDGGGGGAVLASAEDTGEEDDGEVAGAQDEGESESDESDEGVSDGGEVLGDHSGQLDDMTNEELAQLLTVLRQEVLSLMTQIR